MKSDESTRKKKKAENDEAENDGADVNDVEIPEMLYPTMPLAEQSVHQDLRPITPIARSSHSDIEKKPPSRRFKGNTSTKPQAKHPPDLHSPSHSDLKDDEQMLAQLKQPPTQQDSQPNPNNSIQETKRTDDTKPTRMKRLPSTNTTELSGVTDAEFDKARHEAFETLEVIASRRRTSYNGQPAPCTGVATRVPGSGIAPKGVVKTAEHGRIGAFAVPTRAPGDLPRWASSDLLQPNDANQEEENKEEEAEEPRNDSTTNDHSRFSRVGGSFSSVAPINIDDDMEEQPDSVSRKKELWFNENKKLLGPFILLASLLSSVTVAYIKTPRSVDDKGDNEIYIPGCGGEGTIKRMDRYLDFKSALELRNVTGFDDPCAPRNLALSWLADADNFESSSISNADLYQRYAMVLFYVSANINSTIVAAHAGKVENPWLTDDQVCLWYGITCSNSPEDDTVTGIKLSGLGLSGPFPSELVILVPHLKTLNVFENDLTGIVPVTLYSSSALVNLNMGSNKLSGPICEIEWTTNNIKKLNLANNALSGSIPGSIGSLTNLVELDLSYNDFTGSMPSEMFNLPYLYTLNLQYNSLNGSLPITLTTSLEYINLDYNKVGGELPASLYNLTNLVTLSLEGNEIRGTLSQLIGKLHNMEELLLRKNDINGKIPNAISKLSNLKILDLGNNLFGGSIPSQIGKMELIEILFVNNNLFSGSIPSDIGMLTNLLKIQMSNNGFEGSIPSEIGQLTRLTQFHLTGNFVTQDIPTEFGKLSDLEFLRVDANPISTQVPAEVCKLREETLSTFTINCRPGSTQDGVLALCDCCSWCQWLARA